MGESVVYEHATRQGKYLRLILEAPEWGGEYEAVIVALKIAANMGARVMEFLHTQPFVAYKSLPVHTSLCFFGVYAGGDHMERSNTNKDAPDKTM